ERALAGGAGAAGREAIAPIAAGERPRPPVAPTTAPALTPMPAPDPDDPRYRPALGLLGRLLPAVRRARLERAEEAFRHDYAAWAATAERVERDHADAMRRHAEALAAWAARCRAQAEAVRRLCHRVLAARPDDPACLPRAFEVGHDAAAGVTVIDYRLPRPDDLPTLRGARYVLSRDAVEEVRLKPAELNRLYDGVVCQLALRALHDLFEADAAGALGAIVFNGWVDEGPDGFADGRGRACILSVRAERRPFRALDLTKADPCACYRALDGVGGTRPHRLMPVAPLAVPPRAGGDDRAPGHTTASRPAKEASRLAPAAA
ncbi:MAG TPA: hypothetical protein VFG47_18985, partial [Geminicoccaceae bacterium]|nr:hypothetical protein [Geminicoccaceae bacterium]